MAEAGRREQAATALQAAYRGWEGRQIAADRWVRVVWTRFVYIAFEQLRLLETEQPC